MKLQRIGDAPSGAARLELLIGIAETELLLGCLSMAQKHLPITHQNMEQRHRLSQMRRELIKGMRLWKPEFKMPK